MPLRTTSVAAAVAVAATALTFSGAPARADAGAVVGPAAYPTCNATLSNLVRTYRNGDWATLEIFWDGANGTNCAYLRHGPAAPGGAIFTYVQIQTCTTNVRGARCEPRGGYNTRYRDQDGGDFTSYAGKVTVDGRDRCIYAWGAVDINGDDAWDKYIDSNGSTSPGALPLGNHCG